MELEVERKQLYQGYKIQLPSYEDFERKMDAASKKYEIMMDTL